MKKTSKTSKSKARNSVKVTDLRAKKNPVGGDAASGLPTGKRQHKPFTITKPIDKA